MGTAQTGRTHGCTDQCCIRSRKSLPPRSRPHMGVKRTCRFAPQMSAFDPKRTLSSFLNGLRLNRYDCSVLSLGGGNETARVHQPSLWRDDRVADYGACPTG